MVEGGSRKEPTSLGMAGCRRLFRLGSTDWSDSLRRLARSAEEHIHEHVRIAEVARSVRVSLAYLDGVRIGERPQAPLAYERLVDTPEPAAVGRVHRRAERHRLAV